MTIQRLKVQKNTKGKKYRITEVQQDKKSLFLVITVIFLVRRADLIMFILVFGYKISGQGYYGFKLFFLPVLCFCIY